MYDAILVGGRCAGSPTAMLLARRGYRVLLLDKSDLDGDVLSTHFLWPRGMSYLNRWGLSDRVLANTPYGTRLTLFVEGIEVGGSADIAEMQAICHEFNSTLLVDIAHDFGAMGPGGTGELGIQNVLGKVDLVMGSFSKTFASNGGFWATRSPAVREYCKAFAGPHLFSNALSPTQAAVAGEALRIVRSSEGDQLRSALARNIETLRRELGDRGLQCIGKESPIVPMVVGSEQLLRVMARAMLHRKLHANAIEYPAVSLGTARFRFQVMASHTNEHARIAAEVTRDVFEEASALLSVSEQAGQARPAVS